LSMNATQSVPPGRWSRFANSIGSICNI
jgi:hypothetical protein